MLDTCDGDEGIHFIIMGDDACVGDEGVHLPLPLMREISFSPCWQGLFFPFVSFSPGKGLNFRGHIQGCCRNSTERRT